MDETKDRGGESEGERERETDKQRDRQRERKKEAERKFEDTLVLLLPVAAMGGVDLRVGGCVVLPPVFVFPPAPVS